MAIGPHHDAGRIQHSHFIGLELLPWRPISAVIDAVAPGVMSRYHELPALLAEPQAKLLRQDVQSGAFSMLVSYQAGFTDDDLHWHSEAEEGLLLEGTWTRGGRAYEAPSYWYFPPGVPHGLTHAETDVLYLVSYPGAWDYHRFEEEGEEG